MLRRADRLLLLSLAIAACPPGAAAQSADSLPPRRAGYWEVRMVTEKPPGAPPLVSQMCVDAATDRELMNFGLRMSKDTCKRYDLKRAGAGWRIEAECKFGPVTSVTRTTVTGDFQSSVTVRIEGTSDGLPLPGAPKGPQETAMVQTSRWMSAACPAGMTAGDIALPGGIRVNVRQLKGLHKLLPNIQIR
jgi:hypothetical protein